MSSTHDHAETHQPLPQEPHGLSHHSIAQPNASPVMEKTVLYIDDKPGLASLSSDSPKDNHDAEKGDATSASHDLSTHEVPKRGLAKLFPKWKILAQIFIWLLFTA